MSKINGVNIAYPCKVFSDRMKVYYMRSGGRGESFAEDVRAGLRSERKFIPPKYFYDHRGSLLFDKICLTDEYYVTRTEESILEECSAELAGMNKDKEVIVELGSGNSRKTRKIIESFMRYNPALEYVPIDVSHVLVESSERLVEEYKLLQVTGIISEYEAGVGFLENITSKPKIIVFLGSSIGNFDPEDAAVFTRNISSKMFPGDSLLVGFDMKKDPKILNAAYNDSAGVTAEFNLNLLERINNELMGNFDMNNFVHNAFYNEELSRIEMHLVSKSDQKVKIECIDEIISFRKGETIHTENSYKFTDDVIEGIADKSGLEISKCWKDKNSYFSLYLFQK